MICNSSNGSGYQVLYYNHKKITSSFLGNYQVGSEDGKYELTLQHYLKLGKASDKYAAIEGEAPPSSQNQFPRFLNKVMTEAMVCTLGHELEPCFSVDVSRLYKDTLSPEHEFLVTTASSEANTLFNKTRT